MNKIVDSAKYEEIKYNIPVSKVENDKDWTLSIILYNLLFNIF